MITYNIQTREKKEFDIHMSVDSIEKLSKIRDNTAMFDGTKSNGNLNNYIINEAIWNITNLTDFLSNTENAEVITNFQTEQAAAAAKVIPNLGTAGEHIYEHVKNEVARRE